jgi:hypothetical protein
VLVAAAPAIAQVASQEFSERRVTSGKASPSVSIRSTGDNVNMCPTVEQVANTGNVANQHGVIQYDIQNPSDIGFMGSPLTITPDVTETCEQTISQAAAAG